MIKCGLDGEIQEACQLPRNLLGRKGTCKRKTTADGETSAQKKVKAWAVVGPAACWRCYLLFTGELVPTFIKDGKISINRFSSFKTGFAEGE